MIKKAGAPDPSSLYSFEQQWPTVSPLVKKLIHHQPISKLEWQNLFYDLHKICSWDERGCQKVIKALESELVFLFINEVKARLLFIDDGQQHLKCYVDCWIDFCRHFQRFPVAFQQLDLAAKNNMSRFHRPEGTVQTLMLKLWNQHIMAIHQSRLQESVQELIVAERNGHIIDSRLILGMRESCIYLDEHALIPNSYLQTFEQNYVKGIKTYYMSLANEYLKEFGIFHYIKWASGRLEEEEHRAELYMSFDAAKICRETCTEVLVAYFAEQVLYESPRYIQANDSDNMRILFQFFDRVPSWAEKFLQSVGKHIVTTGISYLNSSSSVISNSCEKFVEKLIDCYKQFSAITKLSFNNDLRALVTLERAFEVIVNDTRIFKPTYDSSSNTPMSPSNHINKNIHVESRCAELSAGYCDLLLRRTALSRKFSAEDITARLNEMLLIIRYIKNKDAFIKCHKMYLTRRLYLNTSINFDREETFVNSLKELAGMPQDHINKLIRMFKDIKASDEFQKQFLKTLQPEFNLEEASNNNNNYNNNYSMNDLTSQVETKLTTQDNNNITSVRNHDFINIKILNPSAWIGVGEKCNIKLPDEVLSFIPDIEALYAKNYSGRKLEWSHQMSTGTLEFNTKNGKYDLEVHAAQLALLSIFNSDPNARKSLESIRGEVNLNLVDLKRTLWVS